MPLHLIKLSVGATSIKDLKGWIAERVSQAKAKGLPPRHVHVTRMTPNAMQKFSTADRSIGSSRVRSLRARKFSPSSHSATRTASGDAVW